MILSFFPETSGGDKQPFCVTKNTDEGPLNMPPPPPVENGERPRIGAG